MAYRVLVDGIDILDYNDPSMALISPHLIVEVDMAGSFEFTLPAGHKYYDNTIMLFKSTIEVYEDEYLQWFGRPIEEKIVFNKCKTYYCEGPMSFFRDTIVEIIDEYESIKLHDFFSRLIQMHNKQCGRASKDREFQIGTVTVPNDTVYRKTSRTQMYDALKGLCFDTVEGHILFRRNNNINYIDWLKDYTYESNQTVEYGKNLIDFTQEFDGSDFITQVLPLGKSTDEDPEGITVTSANGSLIVSSKAAVQKYGNITQIKTWSDISDSYELLEEAQRYLNNIQYNAIQINCDVAELHNLDKTYIPFQIGQKILINIPPLNIMDMELPVTKIDIRLDRASKSVTLGRIKKTSLTRIKKNEDQDTANNDAGYTSPYDESSYTGQPTQPTNPTNPTNTTDPSEEMPDKIIILNGPNTETWTKGDTIVYSGIRVQALTKTGAPWSPSANSDYDPYVIQNGIIPNAYLRFNPDKAPDEPDNNFDETFNYFVYWDYNDRTASKTYACTSILNWQSTEAAALETFPAYIKIDEVPSKDQYEPGDWISYDGIKVVAYKSNYQVWYPPLVTSSSPYAGGFIPKSELTITPTTAPQPGSSLVDPNEGTFQYTVKWSWSYNGASKEYTVSGSLILNIPSSEYTPDTLTTIGSLNTTNYHAGDTINDTKNVKVRIWKQGSLWTPPPGSTYATDSYYKNHYVNPKDLFFSPNKAPDRPTDIYDDTFQCRLGWTYKWNTEEKTLYTKYFTMNWLPSSLESAPHHIKVISIPNTQSYYPGDTIDYNDGLAVQIQNDDNTPWVSTDGSYASYTDSIIPIKDLTISPRQAPSKADNGSSKGDFTCTVTWTYTSSTNSSRNLSDTFTLKLMEASVTPPSQPTVTSDGFPDEIYVAVYPTAANNYYIEVKARKSGIVWVPPGANWPNNAIPLSKTVVGDYTSELVFDPERSTWSSRPGSFVNITWNISEDDGGIVYDHQLTESFFLDEENDEPPMIEENDDERYKPDYIRILQAPYTASTMKYKPGQRIDYSGLRVQVMKNKQPWNTRPGIYNNYNNGEIPSTALRIELNTAPSNESNSSSFTSTISWLYSYEKETQLYTVDIRFQFDLSGNESDDPGTILDDDGPNSIRIIDYPNKLDYYYEETLDFEGVTVKAYKADGSIWDNNGAYAFGFIPVQDLVFSPTTAPDHYHPGTTFTVTVMFNYGNNVYTSENSINMNLIREYDPGYHGPRRIGLASDEALINNGFKRTYKLGEEIDLSRILVYPYESDENDALVQYWTPPSDYGKMLKADGSIPPYDLTITPTHMPARYYDEYDYAYDFTISYQYEYKEESRRLETTVRLNFDKTSIEQESDNYLFFTDKPTTMTVSQYPNKTEYNHVEEIDLDGLELQIYSAKNTLLKTCTGKDVMTYNVSWHNSTGYSNYFNYSPKTFADTNGDGSATIRVLLHYGNADPIFADFLVYATANSSDDDIIDDTVYHNDVYSISILTKPTKTQYAYNADLNFSGLSIITYKNGIEDSRKSYDDEPDAFHFSRIRAPSSGSSCEITVTWMYHGTPVSSASFWIYLGSGR